MPAAGYGDFVRKKMKPRILSILFVFFGSPSGFAYHPLITDDTSTQGKGGFQYELNVEYGHDEEETIETALGMTLTYGVVDNLDIAAGIPYLFLPENNGIGDLSLDIKYRFYERQGLMIALKGGLNFPTGDHEKGLGSGMVNGRIFLMVDKEFGLLTFFFNAGYIRNENRVDERKNLWHLSLAGDYKLMESLKIVLNTGIETNPEKGSKVHPVFLLGGLVYSPYENFELSGGIKTGLNSAETDLSVLAGITLRF